MKTIFEHHLPFGALHGHGLPIGAKIVHFAMQHGMPTIWYEFDENNRHGTQMRIFQVVGTGQPVAQHLQHRGTTIDGTFVWHLYEEPAQ